MKLTKKSALLLCTTLFSIAVPCFAGETDNGTKIFTESCSGCHTAKVRPLDNIHMTRDQWKETVDRMMDQGAEVPKGKLAELLDYLVNTRGPAGAADTTEKK